MAKRKGRSRPAPRSRATSSRTTKAARTTRRAKRRASTKPAAARAGTRRRARQIAVATRPIVDLKQVWTTVRPRLPAEFRVHVRRPDDLLVFDLLFDNLKVEPGVVPRLVKKNPSATAALVVEFQPQSFGEQAFLEVSGSEPGEEDGT